MSSRSCPTRTSAPDTTSSSTRSASRQPGSSRAATVKWCTPRSAPATAASGCTPPRVVSPRRVFQVPRPAGSSSTSPTSTRTSITRSSAGAHDPPRTDRRGLRPARVRRPRSRGPQLVHRHAVQRACGLVAVVVSPSRRRTTFRAMSSTAGSSRRTKFALAARMTPFSSKVSASGSSSAGSSCRSTAAMANCADRGREPVLERGDPFFDRSRTGTHLEDRAGEEATAGERAPREVVEERVAHGHELSESGRSGERGLDDLGSEDPTGFVDGGELQLLLRAEVGVDPALAHVERAGQVADREALEAVDGRE